MSEKRGYVIVNTVVDSEDSAKTLAERIVARKLAACVQYSPIKSVYRWKGSIESADEFMLYAKTRGASVDSLLKFIKEEHTYDVPEIIVTPIIEGHKAYLDWVDAETRD